MKRFLRWIAVLSAIVMLVLPFATSAESASYEWRVIKSQQEKGRLSVWYATGQDVTQPLAFKLGPYNMRQIGSPDNRNGVGYIFVVDNTKYYGGIRLTPRDVVYNAVRMMSDDDQVAFIDATNVSNWQDFQRANTAMSAFDRKFPDRMNDRPQVWDGINAAIKRAKEDTKNVQHVVIVITDGEEQGSATSSEALNKQLESLNLPVYVLICTTNGKATKGKGDELMAFGNQRTPNGSAAITGENYQIASQQATALSRRIYKSELELTPEMGEMSVQEARIHIAYEGGSVLAISDGLHLSAAAIPTYTPAPTDTPTPAPTEDPVYLGYRTQNPAGKVMELHRLLKQYGYYSGGETSTYSDDTERAVSQFYEMNGLKDKPAEGGITRAAFEYLQKKKVVPAPTPVPTPAPTEDPVYIGFRTEGRITDKRKLNNALLDLYYLTDESLRNSSEYSDATDLAVAEFYQANGFDAGEKPEGGIGRDVYLFMMGDPSAAAKVTPTPAPTETPDPAPVYIGPNAGTNFDVGQVQGRLLKLYYYTGEANGIYSVETEEAVRAFCKQNGYLTPSTGQGLTKEAYDALMGEYAVPMPTATPDPSVKFYMNDLTGSDAAKVRQRLIALGYLAPNAAKDSTTMSDAIHAFCMRNEISDAFRADAVTLAVFDKLMGQDARKAIDDPVSLTLGDGRVGKLSEGAHDQLIAFQNKLKDLGYFEGTEDNFLPGVFDAPTAEAYARFLEVNGIDDPDGIVSWTEQQQVLSSTERNKPLSILERTRKLLTGSVAIANQKVPGWIVVVVVGLIILAMIVLAVIKQKKSAKEKSSVSDSVSGAQLYATQEDKPTEEVMSISEDAPTTVAPEVWQLTFMLTDKRGQSSFESFSMEENKPLVVGRGSAANVKLDAEDTTISREHGHFIYRIGQLFYKDVSKAGSIVDNSRVHNAEIQLNRGSVLTIGLCTIKIEKVPE